MEWGLGGLVARGIRGWNGDLVGILMLVDRGIRGGMGT